MGAYQYQALTKTGRYCKGVIEADSEQHARTLLRSKNLLPTAVGLVKKRHRHAKETMSVQALALLTRQLSTLLKAGIPMDEALRSVAEQSDHKTVRQCIISIRSKVMEGYALAHAMSEYPKAFPELYRATIAAGEHTGRLDLVLDKLADYTEQQQKTRQKIQNALIYPAVMLFVSFSIVGFLLTFVVPKIIEVFHSTGQSLPIMTRVLIHLSHGLQSYGLLALVLLLCCSLLFKRGLSHPVFRLKWDGFLLRLPLISHLIITINASRYIHTFSILFSAGSSVLETMRVSSRLVTNRVMRQRFDEAALRVKEGEAISQSLKDTSFIGIMAAHLLSSGEKSGQLAMMMERSAQQLDDDVRGRIDMALTLLEPLIILLMGSMVLFIVLATLLPIFSMEQSV